MSRGGVASLLNSPLCFAPPLGVQATHDASRSRVPEGVRVERVDTPTEMDVDVVVGEAEMGVPGLPL